MNIKDLVEDSYNNAMNKGFYKNDNNVEYEAIIEHLEEEVSELDDAFYYKKINTKNYNPNSFESELSDIIIRIMSFCGYANIDIEKHIIEKMEYNKKRPYKHGKTK